MNPEWGAVDRRLDDDTAIAVLSRQFPGLRPVEVTGRYEGMDNQAVEVNGDWLFRFPKRAEGEPPLRMELGLLPRLEEIVPVRLPRYELVGRADERFPYLFAGYCKLPGVPALGLPPPPVEDLSPVLAQVLSAIHSFPAEEAMRLGVFVEPEDSISRQREEACGWLEELRSALPASLFAGVESRLAPDRQPASYGGPARFLHADFSAEHLLVDPATKAVTGLIDWTDASVGDPALDFSYLWVWQGEPLVSAILRDYTPTVDVHFRERVDFHGLCTALAELKYGIQTGREQNRRAGLLAIERAFG